MLTNQTKTISSYATPIHPRRTYSQSSAPFDNSSFISNRLVGRDHILPQTAASNRLKTLRSLLFRGHRTLGIDQTIPNTPSHRNHDLDSTLSEYHIRSISQSMMDSQTPKKRYEEQEDCVELKSECSIVTARNYAQTNKTKSNEGPRQINSWDDI